MHTVLLTMYKGRSCEFFVKDLRKCIKKMDFLFLFLLFCINIVHEYVKGNVFAGEIL